MLSLPLTPPPPQNVPELVSRSNGLPFPTTLLKASIACQRSSGFKNSLSVITRLLFNVYKPVSNSYVNVILPGNVGWGWRVGKGGGGGGEKVIPTAVLAYYQ